MAGTGTGASGDGRTLGAEDLEAVLSAARMDGSGRRLERVVARIVARARTEAAEEALRRHSETVLRGLEEGVRDGLRAERLAGQAEGAHGALARFEALPGVSGGAMIVPVGVVRHALRELVVESKTAGVNGGWVGTGPGGRDGQD